MAKSAGLHELSAPALRSSRNVRVSLLPGRRILQADHQDQRCKQQHEFRCSPTNRNSMLAHSPPAGTYSIHLCASSQFISGRIRPTTRNEALYMGKPVYAYMALYIHSKI